MARNPASKLPRSPRLLNNPASSTFHNHRANKKVIHLDPFSLLSPDDSSIKQAIDLAEDASLGRHRVCVVSIISKDALGTPTKNHLVKSLLGSCHSEKVLAKGPMKRDSGSDDKFIENDESHESMTDDNFEIQVTGQIDPKANIIVLNLTSFLESDKLYKLARSTNPAYASNNGAAQGILLDSWPRWNQNLIKVMLILFIMSHIVVFYSPELTIDYSLIRLIKIVEMLRLKSQARVTDILETIASRQTFPHQWIRQARLCCPRALFVCDSTYIGRTLDQSDITNIVHDIEDQIHKLLKKTGILSQSQSQNQQGGPIFLTEREDFVYLLTKSDLQSMGIDQRCASDLEESNDEGDFYSRLFASLALDISDGDNQSKTDHAFDSQSNSESKRKQIGAGESNLYTKPTNKVCQIKFKRFLDKHIAEIQSVAQLDQDNKQYIGKQSNVILPRYDNFLTVLSKLKSLFLPSVPYDESNLDQSPNVVCWRSPDERRFVDIYDLFNYDELFSKLHCNKTRLAAFEFYLRGLQFPLPDNTTHKDSLDSAKRLYSNHARGSAFLVNLNLLTEQCDLHWQNLSQSNLMICDGRDKRPTKINRSSRTIPCNIAPSVSSTNNTGMNSQSTKPSLSIARRANGIKVLTLCDCGRYNNILVTPADRRKKLERVNIQRIDD